MLFIPLMLWLSCSRQPTRTKSTSTLLVSTCEPGLRCCRSTKCQGHWCHDSFETFSRSKSNFLRGQDYSMGKQDTVRTRPRDDFVLPMMLMVTRTTNLSPETFLHGNRYCPSSWHRIGQQEMAYCFPIIVLTVSIHQLYGESIKSAAEDIIEIFGVCWCIRYNLNGKSALYFDTERS